MPAPRRAIAGPCCPDGRRPRLFESLPLVCPNCRADMRIIAFITDAASIERILEYIGEPPRPPPIAPAPMPDWDRLKPPAPDVEPLCELDQRVAC